MIFKASLFLLFVATCIGGGQPCLAQDRVLTITLQNAPNNMEPVAEPTRIRVDDRSSVGLRLVNVSPIDVCSLSGRTPTPTTETNPMESLVTTISGLGAFGLSTSRASSYLNEVRPAIRTAPRLDDPEYKRFLEAAAHFDVSAQNVIAEQTLFQGSLDADLQALANYISADYRGTNWRLFHPKDDTKLDTIRSDFGNPVPSIADAALSQATLDEMTNWASDLHKKHDNDGTAESALRQMDATLAKEKAIMSILSDNNTALKTAQGTVQTSYVAILKVYADFQRMLDQRVLTKSPADAYLIQDFPLGTDRKATVTGVLSCVSDVDGKTPTTDQINYSILYQNVPNLTASAGLLTGFLEKRVIGITNVASTNAAGFKTIFAVTDSAQAQIFPMAYVNYRVLPYCSTHWKKNSEDELIITTSLSAGFGINPNSGTNQPEFFAGAAFGFNRLMIHPGVHFGRTQNLGGGFTLNNTVPTGFTGNAPITWSYHPAFSIGFSVRVAPL